MKRITVVGTGYVGMSMAVLLSQKNDVTAIDIDKKRVNQINDKKSTVKDSDIDEFLSKKDLSLNATTEKSIAYKDPEIIIIATPTDYNPETNYFNTSSVESVIQDIVEFNEKAIIIIKSTVPIGFTKSMIKKYRTDRILFSPEFLREGKALHDNLYPSRIIVSGKKEYAKFFIRVLKNVALKNNIDHLYTDPSEAEAIKLFSNTYLAMRVAFFNELDNYAMFKNLDAYSIVKGVSLDPRIGDFYNNPSFGYGGYCLPKDTMQMQAEFSGTPQSIIGAIVESNKLRKKFVAECIIKKSPSVVGIFQIAMKSNSDNHRASSIIDVMDILNKNSIKIVIYDPSINNKNILDYEVISDLKLFKSVSDLIITNRISNELNDCIHKVFSRDLFNND
ncbi:nucleotide sugar dehydrogenase [Gammaproteobacteria bacterium]|nr:nucleotide sugar dehydrogenase [Gammaproteobacteria bacterium]